MAMHATMRTMETIVFDVTFGFADFRKILKATATKIVETVATWLFASCTLASYRRFLRSSLPQ